MSHLKYTNQAGESVLCSCPRKGDCDKRCSLYKRIMSLKTHGDLVREMSDEELSAWFWRMLKYTQGFTDSRSALENWLKSTVEPGEVEI